MDWPAVNVYHYVASLIHYRYDTTSSIFLNEQILEEYIVNLDPNLLFPKEDSWIIYYFDTPYYETTSSIFWYRRHAVPL